MTEESLIVELVYSDIIVALSSLKCGMAPEDYKKSLEHLKYCEKVLETAKERVKRLKK